MKSRKMRKTTHKKGKTRKRPSLTSVDGTGPVLSPIDHALILDSTADGIYCVDLNGLCTYANLSCVQMLRYRQREELIGKHIHSLIHHTRRDGTPYPESECRMYQAFRSGCGTRVDDEVFWRADGTSFPVEYKSQPIFRDGKMVGALATFYDLSKELEARRHIAGTESRFKSLIENISDVVFVFGQDNVITYVSPSVEPIAGYKADQMVGRSIVDFMHPDELEAALAVNDLAVANPDRDYREQLRYLHADGSWRDCETVTCSRLHVPTIAGLVTTFRDISERMRAEEALSRGTIQLHAITTVARDAIVMMDNEGRVGFWNPAAETLFGYPLHEAIGVPLHDLIAPARYKEACADGLSAFKHSGQGAIIGTTRQIEARRKDGSEVPVELSVTAVKLHGRWHAVGIVRDITDRKRSEQERLDHLATIRNGLEQFVVALAATVESRDPYTAGHQSRVARLCQAIAAELGLDEETLYGLKLGASIHDIGKIHVPSEILCKPGRLTPIEYELVKSHVDVGYQIIKDIQFPWPIADMIRQHHERLDGSGYPLGLKEGQIRLESKILGVADVVESMMSHRPYRAALGIDLALAELVKGRGVKYDSNVVETCIKLFKDHRFSFDKNGSSKLNE